MLDFSFICPTNNMDMFNKNVSESLEKQTFRNFEVICVDTQKEHFSSAANALNYGASLSSGKYLVFLHHDIVIEDKRFVEKLYKLVNKYDFLIGGVAGARFKEHTFHIKNNIYTNIIDGPEKVRNPWFKKIKKVISAETVDECFFVIPRKVFDKRQFIEYFPSWHLYSVEYSLWANKTCPGSVKVFPLKLYHISDGASMDKSYFKTLDLIRKEYNQDICTTVNSWCKNECLYQIKVICRNEWLHRIKSNYRNKLMHRIKIKYGKIS